MPTLPKTLLQFNFLRHTTAHGLRLIPLARVQEVVLNRASVNEGGGWQVVAELDGDKQVVLETFEPDQRERAEDKAVDWGAKIFAALPTPAPRMAAS